MTDLIPYVRRAGWTASLALAAAVSPLTAQQRSGEIPLPGAWLRNTGLTGIGSAARDRGVLPPGSPRILDQPARRLGLSWFAGNPAGLPWEVRSSWAALAAEHEVVSGDYRRPLDPVRLSRAAAKGNAWGAIDDRRAATGGVEIGRSLSAPGANGLAIMPYSGNPFLSTDAEQPDLRMIDAALDGALGIRVGAWGIGIGATYAAAEQRTVAHPTQRYLRDTEYVGTVGILRALGDGGLRAGLHVRIGAAAAVTAIASLTEGTEVRTLVGYTEPEPIVISVPGAFHRRTGRHLREGTASLVRERDGFAWLLFASAAEMSEEMTRQRLAAPSDPHDIWDVERATIGGGLYRTDTSLGSWLLLARGERETGTGRIADVNEPVYTTVDEYMGVALTWRPPWQTESLRTALRTAVTYTRRQHKDRLSRMATDLIAWSPMAGAEVSWAPVHRLRLALSYSLHVYAPSGTLPLPDRFGTSTRELIGRELGHDVTAARPQAIAFALTWSPERADITLRAEHARANVLEPERRFDIHPDGRRGATMVSIEIRPL